MEEENEYEYGVYCDFSRQIITCWKDDKIVKSCVHWLYQPQDAELEYTEALHLDLSEYDRVRVFWLYGKNIVEYGLKDYTDKLKMGKIVINMPNGEVFETEHITDELLGEIVWDNEADDAKSWDVYEYCKEGVEELGWSIENDTPDECYDTELIELAK
jgi:hypothetical protein